MGDPLALAVGGDVPRAPLSDSASAQGHKGSENCFTQMNEGKWGRYQGLWFCCIFGLGDYMRRFLLLHITGGFSLVMILDMQTAGCIFRSHSEYYLCKPDG